jgi:hypothetical protein
MPMRSPGDEFARWAETVAATATPAVDLPRGMGGAGQRERTAGQHPIAARPATHGSARMAAENDFSLVEVQTIKGMRRSPASRSTCNHAVMLVAEVADIHARGAAAATLLGHLNINI